MKLSRLAVSVTIPAVLSLAACSGGSSGVIGNNVGTGGQQANIRFVNASPDLGSFDVYFQATGAAQPTAPASSTTTNVSYGIVTPFVAESPTSATVTVRAAGSGANGTVLGGLACPIPQLATNAKYTVTFSGTAGTGRKCLIFQDFDYSTAAQYRVHNAALGTPSQIAYATAATSTPPGTAVTYVSAQVATRGGDATTGSATYTQVQPAGPIGNATSNPAFVIGPNTGGPAFAVTNSLNASSLFASGSTAQPDTSGSLNFTGTAGSSVFAIDCTAASVASFPGVSCNGGVALIGTFDTL